MQVRNHSRIRTPRPSGFVVERRAHLIEWAVHDILASTTCYQIRVALGELLDAGIHSPVALEAAKLREEELA